MVVVVPVVVSRTELPGFITAKCIAPDFTASDFTASGFIASTSIGRVRFHSCIAYLSPFVRPHALEVATLGPVVGTFNVPAGLLIPFII